MSKDRIVRSFAAARAQGRAAFIPYVALGYPSPAACLEVIEGLVEGGADLLELGIPFSDPLADGPVLQAAAQAALQAGTTWPRALDALARVPALAAELPLVLCAYANTGHARGVARCAAAAAGPVLQAAAQAAVQAGTTWPRALDLLARVRALAPELPLVLLVYANTVHARGVERFAGEAAEAGADGVILPDWPPDEGGGLREALARAGLAAVGLVSPVSPVGRIAQIAAASQGFLYAVSVTGVTGERPRLSRELEPLVQRIRQASSLPVAAGFGISRPEDAAAAGRLCDGVIVGSALARRIAEAQGQNLGRLARQVA